MRKLNKRERILKRRKKFITITLWLDADVLALWRATGKGWQTRAAAVLATAAPSLATTN